MAVAVLGTSLVWTSPSPAASSQVAGVVDRSTISGKVLVDYQGWFRRPGDGSAGHGWSHWTTGDAEPSASTISVYQYLDLTGLDSASLCPTRNLTIQGRPASLSSSFPKETAERQFEWMKEYGIDGASVQRFAENIAASVRLGDHVLRNIRSAAENNTRVFAIEYDLSHHTNTPEQVVAAVEADWRYLVDTLKIAMWDEVNEGTALFRVVSLRSQAPDQGTWVTLDHDGFTLPSDWYLRLAYELHRTLAGTIPSSAALPKSPWITTAQNCGVLTAAASLGVGQSITSCDRRSTLTLKPDGDLVVLKGGQQTRRNGAAGLQGSRVAMQSSGDLVEYTAQGHAIWSTKTADHDGAFVRLQDDGVATVVDATGLLVRTP